MRHPTLRTLQSAVLGSLLVGFIATSPSSTLAQAPLDVAAIVRQKAPAVVAIFEDGTEGGRVPRTAAPVGDEGESEDDDVRGAGFLISPEGFIVTINDVIEEAENLAVRVSDVDEPAKLVARDSQSGIAVLKIDPRPGMSTIAWGDPDKIQVGDWALSIGKGLRSGTMAALGIISARATGNFRDLIRTDLQISKNSAGGPLLNAAGEVIGVVLPPAGNAEFASAISSQTARFVADQLMQTGRVERSYLGVDLQVITPPLAQALGLADTRGALVASVEPDSAAAKGGVEVGDVITRFRNTDISSPSELSRAVASEKPSSQVQLHVVRQGTSREVVVIVEARRTGGAKAPETVEAPGKKLGLVLAGLNEATRRQLGGEASGGAMVQRVETGSPAAENGIEVGDVILSANTRDVKGPSDVAAEWSRAQAEKKPILLRIYRNGRVMFVAVPS